MSSLTSSSSPSFEPHGESAGAGVSESIVDLDDDSPVEPAASEELSESKPAAALPFSLTLENIVSLIVVAASSIFVLVEMHPQLLIRDTLPTGGDMGAHVWGPAFLRDELLPNFRLSGWTPDWYAGFPAYHFYMVLPSLMIVALNVGLPPFVAAGFLIVLAGIVGVADRRGLLEGKRAHFAAVVVALLAILAIGIPYGVAFKVVAVSGLVTMPISAWAMGRLANAPFPIPPLLAVATLPFIFDRSFNIYGGNAASTMAGEFAFSMSLSASMVFIGLFWRAVDTGRNRGWAAVMFAVTVLLHLIPAVFAIGVAVVIYLTRIGTRQTINSVGIGLSGAALSAFWLLPFLLRREFLNDMGWEKLTTYTNYLFSRDNLNPADVLRNSPPFQLVFLFGVVGLILSLLTRTRLGVVFSIVAFAAAMMFRFMPQGRLWNARLLPFYYLSVYLLGAIGVALLLREIGKGLARSRVSGGGETAMSRAFVSSGALLAFLGVFVAMGLPLQALPGGGRDGNGVYTWGPLQTTDTSYVPGWSTWNFSGYQARQGDASGGGWDEFRQLMVDMGDVGTQTGCGRTLWEFSGDLNRYGTTMAPMLLPHFTDGCIGSMEGLYFESSGSVPFHFLMQSELGEKHSRAQRDLPYRDFDLESGIDHMQMFGVKYYLAFSDLAVSAARGNAELTEVATSGPWVAFLVADSELVTPLAYQPAVVTNVDHKQDEWLDMGVEFFENPESQDVFLAKDGPADWERLELIEISEPPLAEGETAPPERWGGVVPVTAPQRIDAVPTTVSNIATDTSKISFNVDQIGQPVLVKTSYFPNWKADGATGPYRVAPNLMVVVPTSTEVTLSYGHTWVEYFSWLVTLGGIAGLILLTREDKRTNAAIFDPVGRWMSGEPAMAGAAVGAAVGGTALIDSRSDAGVDMADPDDLDHSSDSIELTDSATSVDSSYDAGYDDGYEDGFRDGEAGTHRSVVDPPDA